MTEILFKNRALETFVTEIAEAYAELWPAEYRRFKEIIAEESAALINPSALSSDGTLLNFCKLPANLYAFIRHQAFKRLGIRDFFKDKENYYLLCRMWPELRIKRTPTQRLRVKGDTLAD